MDMLNIAPKENIIIKLINLNVQIVKKGKYIILINQFIKIILKYLKINYLSFECYQKGISFIKPIKCSNDTDNS